MKSASPWIPLVCLTLLAGCVPKEVSQYIGEDPKLVYNYNYLVDQTTMQFDESKPSVDWGMSVVWLGDHYLLSAEQNITPNKLTQRWQVVAVQDIPLLQTGQILAMGNCMDDGVHNSRVVAIAVYDQDKQWLDQFVSAWAYDYSKDVFVPYPTGHLQCFNPRFGLALDSPKPYIAAPLPLIPAPAAITRPLTPP